MTIEDRLEKFEGKLARVQFINRLLVILGIGALLLMWIFASGTPNDQEKVLDEVRAKRFIVVDDNGNIRGGLAVFKDGSNLSLGDENGMTRILLNVTGDGSILKFGDEEGKPCAFMSASKDGPCLNMYDENRKGRLGLAVFKDRSVLSLLDENGEFRALLEVNNYGPCLSLYDENGITRSTLGKSQTETKDGRTTTFPESSLLLYNQDGSVIWVAP